jgi:hypothetical protein
MSIEYAFGLREALKGVMTDPDTIDMLAQFTIYCSLNGLEISEEFAKDLYDFSWTLTALGLDAAANYFLGDAGMDSLNETLDELVAIEDSVEGFLDTDGGKE